ncbi:TraR/DksA family transcriptional regulator [Streptomyces alfalfae]|uniref:TraR/DksA family transcriptional regulator n=1 Tax=Streptomyces alfalfae TaxID=1642299 RepID=UPI00281231BC|nr:TraR/DksA C4-type zinc finger protein [Streptomyces alfalfae]
MVNHQTIGDRAAHLPPEDLAALQENLREQLLFRREQLRKIDAPPRAGTHRQSAARAEVRDKLAASARMVLADVEAALRRIAEGRYGACHLCRRPVERERLMIVPQARYCGRCQHVREAQP